MLGATPCATIASPVLAPSLRISAIPVALLPEPGGVSLMWATTFAAVELPEPAEVVLCLLVGALAATAAAGPGVLLDLPDLSATIARTTTTSSAPPSNAATLSRGKRRVLDGD